MVRFGILTLEQFAQAGEDRRHSGAHAAYSLLDVGENPSAERIRIFEDISFTLRTSNGTFRTSFPRRFQDVDAAALRWMEKLFDTASEVEIQDRAVSHGLTSYEWAQGLFQKFPRAKFEASDILLELAELSRNGETYIVEPNGRAIQYVKAPFAVSLQHREPMRYPVNHLVAARAKKRFENLGLEPGWMAKTQAGEWKIRKISCVHPQARELARMNPNFKFGLRSVFDITPSACDVLRTMNILNRSYFSEDQLRKGVDAVFRSLRPGGIWIVGRTDEADLSNHATLLRRGEQNWEVLEKIGRGWELGELTLPGATKE